MSGVLLDVDLSELLQRFRQDSAAAAGTESKHTPATMPAADRIELIGLLKLEILLVFPSKRSTDRELTPQHNSGAFHTAEVTRQRAFGENHTSESDRGKSTPSRLILKGLVNDLIHQPLVVQFESENRISGLVKAPTPDPHHDQRVALEALVVDLDAHSGVGRLSERVFVAD